MDERNLTSLCLHYLPPMTFLHARLMLAPVAQLGTKETVGYFASWEDWNPGDNALGNLPPYVTTGAPSRGDEISQASQLCRATCPSAQGGIPSLRGAAHDLHLPMQRTTLNATVPITIHAEHGNHRLPRVHVVSKSAACACAECCLQIESLARRCAQWSWPLRSPT